MEPKVCEKCGRINSPKEEYDLCPVCRGTMVTAGFREGFAVMKLIDRMRLAREARQRENRRRRNGRRI